MASFERAMVVSYKLCIMTTALSLSTIRLKFAIECLHTLKSTGTRLLWDKIFGGRGRPM